MRGTPISLLNDRSLAAVAQVPASAAARRSFTEVLPTLPVTPTTRSGNRSRASRPQARRAAPVSSTTMAVPPTGGRAVR